MNALDIVLAIALGFGFLKGFSKGLIIEVASLGALFLGLIGALRFSDFVADLVKGFVDWNPLAVQTVSYLLVFIVIVYAISLLAKGLTKVIRQASLGLFNKFLGAFFGVIKWAVLMSVALFFFDQLNAWVPIVDAETMENSVLYEPITAIGEYLFSWGSEWSEDLPKDLI